MTNATFPETRATDSPHAGSAHITRILSEMDDARRRTLELFSIVPDEEVLHRSPGFGYRPLLWHLAHIGVFEAYWILQKVKGDPPIDERYERVFDPIATPRENSTNLPSRDEMKAFLARVRNDVKAYADQLAGNDVNGDANPLLRGGYVFDLVIEHERQHQETLAYLFHLLPPESKQRPAVDPRDDVRPSEQEITAAEKRLTTDAPAMIEIPAGACVVGATSDAFAYDNALPPHTIDVPTFRIARLPVTNDEYARFIRQGGYERSELWTPEGWACREREGWTAPLYWRGADGNRSEVTMFGDREAFAGGLPVSGVSWYEAEAYARWAGARLPTETEWEKAASWDAQANRKRRFAWGDDEPTPARGNFDLVSWGKMPVERSAAGASPYGCIDMTGNVWEWTSTTFAPYTGFEAFPYAEYSEKWFDGEHRVLKGGSWATAPAILRTSFRNFFRRDFRIAFAGLRLAADV